MPNGDCFRPSLSADGRVVVFDSMATNLSEGDSDGQFDVYVFDTATRRMALVSAGPEGRAGDGPSTHASISGDGRWIVYASYAGDLCPGVPTDVSGPRSRVFLFDRVQGSNTVIPIAGAGVDPNGDSRCPRISGDGRFVVFESLASNLVPEDTNGANDVFVHEFSTGRTERVSVSSGGVECLVGGSEGTISSDGRFVAFSSLSDDVSPGDSNGAQDVFVHDRDTGETHLVSVGTGGMSASGSSYSPVLSGDGATLLFESTASDLTPGALPLGPHIFRADLGRGGLVCVSVDSTGRGGEGHSQYPAVSGDGSVMAFASTAENLASVPLLNRLAVFLCRHPGAGVELMSREADGTPAGKDSDYPCVSSDGGWLAFSTKASNICGQSLTGAAVVLVEIATGRLAIVAEDAAGDAAAPR